MKQKIRTFIAVDIHRAVRDAVAEQIELLAATGANVRWADPAGLHLTLKFLGEVDSRIVHEICFAVTNAVESVPTFELEIRGVGAFPKRSRPKTLWLGVGDGREEIIALANRMEERLNPLGFAREGRPYSPHLTIGRTKSAGQPLGALVEMLELLEEETIGRTPISEVVVFSSELTRTGPIYTPLGRAHLTKN